MVFTNIEYNIFMNKKSKFHLQGGPLGNGKNDFKKGLEPWYILRSMRFTIKTLLS